jgi:Concanavalin A-like lectin/glucanases superfamily
LAHSRARALAACLTVALFCGCEAILGIKVLPEPQGDAGATSGPEASPEPSLEASPEAGDTGGCADITGLVGYYSMDANSIAGTRLADGSRNHSDATLVGFSAPLTAAGKFGEALSYPAAGAAYVRISQLGLDQTPGNANSVSLWFYRSAGNINDVLVSLPDSPRYDLWLTDTAGPHLCINTGHGECFGTMNSNMHDRWVHVVAVFNNGDTTRGHLYIDGNDSNATCQPGFPDCVYSATAMTPAYFGGPTEFFFRGLLDEVRIYKRALAASEVTLLYRGQACP